MAVPTVNSVGAVAFGAAADVTVAPGASHTANDIDIVIAESADEAITLATANGFAELTAISPRSITALTRLTVFWRRWNGSDGSPVLEGSALNHIVARMISVSGCVMVGNPWDVTATGTDETIPDTSVSIAGSTTTVPDCLILAIVAQDLPDANSTTVFSGWTNAALANVTEQINNARNVGNGGAIGMASGEKAVAGSFGATTATATSASRTCAMVALAAPASVAVHVGMIPT